MNKFSLETFKQNKMKMKILRIDKDGYASNKKIDISKLKLKLTPKKRKEYLEELAKIEMWCKKNR